MKSRKICSNSARAFLDGVQRVPAAAKASRALPLLAFLHSKSRSVLGIERLHVNADVEFVSSTA